MWHVATGDRRARIAPGIEELGPTLVETVRRHDTLPRIAQAVVVAATRNYGVPDNETDLLHHKTTEIHQAVLTTYPNHDIATVVDWMLLAAINALIAGDQSGANYHLAWADRRDINEEIQMTSIESHPEQYWAAAGRPGPVPLALGPVHPGGPTLIDLLMALFGLSTNADLGGTNADIEGDDTDRRAHAADAARKFSANEANAAEQMQGVGAQGMAQMASGIGGALSGALGGVMGPLTQLPQQAMQAGQGAMQPLMSAMQQAQGADGLAAVDGARLLDSIGGEPGLGSGAGGGDVGGGGAGGTTPTGYLGPPPVPTSSPPTTPAGAPTKSATMPPPGGASPASAHMGAAGMPMVPPGAMGARGEGSGQEKPVEKRVTAPAVPNGQPVKGRLTVPPSAPTTKPTDGKPVVRRRILLPEHKDFGRIAPDEKTDAGE